MINIAVLLTVYNRKEVTIRGLRSLYRAFAKLNDGYSFEVYITDDGSSDGTIEAVAKEFPNIHIIQGDGNLYWCGGMRKAWQATFDSKIKYDFYLWFNDDDELYEDAIFSLFEAYRECGPNCIITGAFHNHRGEPSYGGQIVEGVFLEPNGLFQDVVLMNGNLVLISYDVYKKIGMIDGVFKQSLGDYDYGLRARKQNFMIRLTANYVGLCDRHDIKPYYSLNNSLVERLRILYHPKYNPFYTFIYWKRHRGIYQAVKSFVGSHVYSCFPCLLKYKQK